MRYVLAAVDAHIEAQRAGDRESLPAAAVTRYFAQQFNPQVMG